MGRAGTTVETLGDTHGLVTRRTTQIIASSEGRGWRSLFASTQTESPFEGFFGAVNDYLVVIHLSGPARVTRTLDNKRVTSVVPPGGAFIMPGGIDFGVLLQDQLDTIHFYLPRDIVAEVIEELSPGHTDIDILPRLGVIDPLLEQIGIEIRSQLIERETQSAVYIDYMAYAAAARLVRSHATSSVKPLGTTEGPGLTTRQLRRVVEFIRTNLANNPDLADMATVAGMNPIYFARRFRQSTGMPPHQFLIRIRTEHAKRLLQASQLSIASIAIDCGFCNQEHLTRAFRKQFGTTPAAYRKSIRN